MVNKKVKKNKLTESEEIMKYLERKGFKLKEFNIEKEIYVFQKNKLMIGIKE